MKTPGETVFRKGDLIDVKPEHAQKQCLVDCKGGPFVVTDTITVPDTLAVSIGHHQFLKFRKAPLKGVRAQRRKNSRKTATCTAVQLQQWLTDKNAYSADYFYKLDLNSHYGGRAPL
ncbi:MAG: hypothetical protein PHC97_03280 [Patescibacteria group bacterium]|nr:hypothetical protein [Patescibacteria group bacterium]